MNLIILGPPGAGKGTQSEFLVKNYNLIHLSTGDLFRDEVANKSKIGLLAKSYMDQGKYVPDDVTNSIVENKIKTTKANFIFDGYPRTIDQVKFLEKTLQSVNQKIDLVIYLDISEKTVVDRLLARVVCPKCKTTYNTLFLPPKVNNLCDKDKTPLIQRTDDSDNKKVVTRLKEYNTSTQPLINYFKEQGTLRVIDANLESDIVHQQLVETLGDSLND